MKLTSLLRSAVIALLTIGGISAASAETVKIGISVYAGWMPYYYGDTNGIFADLGKAEGITVEFVPRTYGETIENYASGQTDAIVITNMDLLMGPGSAGIDSTVVVMGDYSNGNDAVIGDGKSVKAFGDLKGKKISIVEKSVSEYLLARGVEQLGGDLGSFSLYNQAESELTTAFTSGQVPVVTTWAPFTLQCEQKVGSVRLFDSAKIPGEIQDLLVVKTSVLKKNPKVGQILAKGWYQILGRMQGRSEAAKTVRTEMAKASECTLAEYDAQLKPRRSSGLQTMPCVSLRARRTRPLPKRCVSSSSPKATLAPPLRWTPWGSPFLTVRLSEIRPTWSCVLIRNT
jgi:NitT/TauT family transport system substrate-binding protein